MKFLIAEDDDSLREVLHLMITAQYAVEIMTAENGKRAIELIQSDGPFDIVICDYKMPLKSGADVYNFLRETYATTPFALVSADSTEFIAKVKTPTHFEQIIKPFDEDTFYSKIQKLLSLKNVPPQKNAHIPIELDLLRKVESTGVAIYIKLSESNFIKVLKPDALFTRHEYNRFLNKKIDHLYIELIDVKQFISNFRKNIFALIDWNNIDTTEAQRVLEHDWQLILEANRNIGWSDSISELCKENITKTIALASQQPEIKKFLEKFKLQNDKINLPVHCYQLVFMTTALLQELDWNSPATIRKMTFACLFHDMDINEVMFKNKIHILNSDNPEAEINQPINYTIFHHPQKAAVSMSNWSSCPADVDKIIYQHHEKFDGSGFPQKLNFLNLFPLAAVFIVAEDLIYHRIHSPNESLHDYVVQRESYYNRGDLKNIYEASVRLAKSI